MNFVRIAYLRQQVLLFLLTLFAAAGQSQAGENASNPLAAVNNIDLRWQYSSLVGGEYLHTMFIDGAYMLTPKLKLKYELHYNVTNATGVRQNDFEKLVIKPIYFPYQKKLSGTWAMKAAAGVDFIIEFGNQAKGIGVGASQIGPFGGFAFSNLQTGFTIIPLVQHFTAVSGPTAVNTTAARIIALQPFGDGYWVKGDVIIPYDWERRIWPSTAEVQLGKNVTKSTAIYLDSRFGIGSARPYDVGLGLGVRFNY